MVHFKKSTNKELSHTDSWFEDFGIVGWVLLRLVIEIDAGATTVGHNFFHDVFEDSFDAATFTVNVWSHGPPIHQHILLAIFKLGLEHAGRVCRYGGDRRKWVYCKLFWRVVVHSHSHNSRMLDFLSCSVVQNTNFIRFLYFFIFLHFYHLYMKNDGPFLIKKKRPYKR